MLLLGLDFPNVAFVVNYDMPHNIDNYIHRIGRTMQLVLLLKVIVWFLGI